MDLDALRVLDAIDEAGSFAKAADKLHKTPSAISYQVSKLEQTLGTEIFNRSHYRAVLTPVGSRILEEGRRLLEQASYVEKLVEQFSDGWEARLELVVDGMLPTAPVLQVLKEMSAVASTTRIQFRIEFLSGVQKRFEESQADLMLVLNYRENHACTPTPLRPVDVGLVVAKEHPLAGQVQVSLQVLQQHVELTVHDSSYQSAHAGAMTFGSERIFYLSDFQTKKSALLAGLGYGWMPLDTIAKELESGILIEVDYTGGSRHRYFPMLVNWSREPLGRAGQLLKEKLEAAFGNGC